MNISKYTFVIVKEYADILEDICIIFPLDEFETAILKTENIEVDTATTIKNQDHLKMRIFLGNIMMMLSRTLKWKARYVTSD